MKRDMKRQYMLAVLSGCMVLLAGCGSTAALNSAAQETIIQNVEAQHTEMQNIESENTETQHTDTQEVETAQQEELKNTVPQIAVLRNQRQRPRWTLRRRCMSII